DVWVTDVNRDGYLDVLAGLKGSNKLGVSLGNGNGTFKATTTFVGPLMFALGDFNADGNLDIAGGANFWTASNLTIMLGNGNGSFKPPPSYGTSPTNQWPRLGDYNGDGVTDIIINGELFTGNSAQGSHAVQVTAISGFSMSTQNAARQSLDLAHSTLD